MANPASHNMLAIRRLRQCQAIRGSFALCAILFLLLNANAARAQFANCAAAGFLGGVDARMAGTALSCDEAVRFTIETPGGPRQVRIIYSTRDLSPGLLGRIADIRRGIERSAAALREIGQGATADITVWASDLIGPAVDDTDTADATAEPIGSTDSECVIALYQGLGGREVAYVIAHEFFHCVQFYTFRDRTRLAASTWWMEGTAEWFASRAYPGRGYSDADVAMFDATSYETALTSMDQESVVFFFWLDHIFGASMAMALMTAMPDSGSEAAQQDKLASFLSANDFQRFAEEYLDRRIVQPGGRAIPSNPFPGDIHVWEESGEHTLRANRFVLARFQLDIACGEWSIIRRDEDGTWKVSRDEEPWEDMPPRLTVAGPDSDRYRVAAFGTQAAGFQVTVEAKRNPCQQCAATTVDDEAVACLIGSWKLASGGYGKQIQQMLKLTGQFESIEYPDLESVLVINRDGTFEFPGPPEDYKAEMRTGSGKLFSGLGTLAMASNGQWSVDGDRLHLCQSPARVNIDLTVVNPDGNAERVQTSGRPESPIRRSRTFSCAGGSLTLVEGAGLGLGVTWEYSRTE
jgi:hypothetical protein